MNTVIVIIFLSLLLLIFLLLCIGKLNISFHFQQQVKGLFAQTSGPAIKLFRQSELNDLPEPLQRYFKHVLKNGQPYIRQVRFLHEGQFRTGVNKGWAAIRGEQYVTIEKPGFIWKGKTKIFTARDMYIRDEGKLIVPLFSALNITEASSDKNNQGELLRWLGELG